jgi:hypothetical protein
MSTSDDLERLADAYVRSGEVVSFYDAFDVVRHARGAGDLADRALAALVRLHDHPAVTDGGRAVVADFLRAYTQRHVKERALAARVLTARDDGRTVRARVGSTLLLSVADAALTADAWSVLRLEGPARLTRLSPARAEEMQADFGLELTGTGGVVVELAAKEASAPKGSRAAPRRLRLVVVVEG